MSDFWNLAGRAGRWGKEFQGNIVCVDTVDDSQWPVKPTVRTRQPLHRASDDVVRDVDTFLEFIDAGTPLALTRESPVMESVFSLLGTRVAQGRAVEGIAGLSLSEVQRPHVLSVIRNAMSEVELSSELLARHAGISPIGMQRLLDYFRARSGDPTVLLVAPPESRDAASTYAAALDRINRLMGGDFGNERRQFQLAVLIVQWMRGLPLARLISDRISRTQERGETVNIAATIRSVMQDVEQIARFQAPKYLACYVDVLRAHMDAMGIATRDDDFPDVGMMLELGVSRVTEVSLMALGLSRTSTIALAEYIIDDELSPQQVLAWLRARNLEMLSLPALVRKEIALRLRDTERDLES